MSEKNTENIKKILDEFIRKQSYKKRLLATRIYELWKDLMGETIMPYTKEIKYKNGTLYVYLSSAALREELNRGKDKIINLLNENLGENIIQKIVFL